MGHRSFNTPLTRTMPVAVHIRWRFSRSSMNAPHSFTKGKATGAFANGWMKPNLLRRLDYAPVGEGSHCETPVATRMRAHLCSICFAQGEQEAAVLLASTTGRARVPRAQIPVER